MPFISINISLALFPLLLQATVAPHSTPHHDLHGCRHLNLLVDSRCHRVLPIAGELWVVRR